jgi:hypothetical protein
MNVDEIPIISYKFISIIIFLRKIFIVIIHIVISRKIRLQPIKLREWSASLNCEVFGECETQRHTSFSSCVSAARIEMSAGEAIAGSSSPMMCPRKTGAVSNSSAASPLPV